MNYLLHLRKDAKLAPYLPSKPLVLSPQSNAGLRLMHSIMSQQLSTKVAAVLQRRFDALFAQQNPLPEQVAALPVEQIRSIGLSQAKAGYIHNVAKFWVDNQLTDEHLHQMESEEVIQLLTQIKGVGRWTVEMQLMFTLARPNIFPVDDLGIQTAMIAIYKPRYQTKKELYTKLHKIAAQWSPYRTYACMHLWRWKDGAV